MVNFKIGDTVEILSSYNKGKVGIVKNKEFLPLTGYLQIELDQEEIWQLIPVHFTNLKVAKSVNNLIKMVK